MIRMNTMIATSSRITPAKEAPTITAKFLFILFPKTTGEDSLVVMDTVMMPYGLSVVMMSSGCLVVMMSSVGLVGVADVVGVIFVGTMD